MEELDINKNKVQTPPRRVLFPKMVNAQIADLKVKFTPGGDGTRSTKRNFSRRQNSSILKHSEEDNRVSHFRKRFREINLQLETIALREETSRHFYQQFTRRASLFERHPYNRDASQGLIPVITVVTKESKDDKSLLPDPKAKPSPMLRVSRKVQRLKQIPGEMEKKASTSSVNERLPELKNASVTKMTHSGQVSVRRGN